MKLKLHLLLMKKRKPQENMKVTLTKHIMNNNGVSDLLLVIMTNLMVLHVPSKQDPRLTIPLIFIVNQLMDSSIRLKKL
jgi:uncharacterized protein YfaS (alpha-2-macroglobulin family)